ncbi:MAG: citrate/2-methylcitrate synthase, partial [Sphingobium sp.]
MSEPLETTLSISDEAAGKIVVRGHDLAALADSRSYEEVVSILWADMVDEPCTAGSLGSARGAAFERLAPFEAIVRGRSTAEALRILLAAYEAPDGSAGGLSAVAWTGLSAVLAVRSAQGLDWRCPDPQQGHVADLLAIATGTTPPALFSRAIERYMILMIDHGISASTYAARIAASTGAGLGSVLMAALSVLEGPSHGGAPSLVLDQLDRISGPMDVPLAVATARQEGRRIMGFGSRAYRGEDIRAALMKREWLAIGGDRGARANAIAVEQAIVGELARLSPSRGLRANVEYYAALLVEAAGIPRAGFTPLFAAA